MATILIGSEAEGAAIISGVVEKGYATQRECLIGGKLHELGIKPEVASKTTKIVLGIRADNAGAVGAQLAETAEFTITELENKAFRAALTADITITAGTKYWLCVIPLLGTLKVKATEVAGLGFKTVGAVKKVSEGVWTTAENKFGTPYAIWGEGTPSAASPEWNFQPPTFNTPRGLYKPFPGPPSIVEVLLQANLTIVFNQQDTLIGAQALAPSLTSKLELKDTVQATQLLAAKLQEQMVLRDTFVAVQTTVANFVSKIEWKDNIQASVAVKFLASMNDKMVLGYGLTAAQAQSIAMNSQIKFQTTMQAKFIKEETGKRVTIFIFEE